MNIYMFAGNAAANMIDILGLNPGAVALLNYLLGGDLGDSDIVLPPEFADAAAAKLAKELIPVAKSKVMMTAKCCDTGEASFPYENRSFNVESSNYLSPSNMGNWQLRAWVDCNWSCDGGCPCECEADCNVSFVIKKNYTFHTGYNSLNNSFGVRLMNAVASLGQLMTQGNLHANYVLWSEGSDVYGFTVRKRCQ